MAASVGGAMFIQAVDATGNVKDAEYIANLFVNVVKEVGEKNVVQIVTDNASNCKAAGQILETRYPQIFWTPCVVHSLNLTLKSIFESSEKSVDYVHLKWISDLMNDVQLIRNFIVNHQMVLALYNKHSKLCLLRVADTRFASNLVMAKRIKEVRPALEKMVMDVDWKVYRDANIEGKSQEVKKCIVNDSWWDDLDYVLSFTEPIYTMLRVADTDSPVLHLIYDMWDTMIEDVKMKIFEHEKLDILTGQSVFFDVVQRILESRWNKSNTLLHCMAHSLVPKYYCQGWLEGGKNGIDRMAPHEDPEVSRNRVKCFKRLFPDQNDFKKVHLEYGSFSIGLNYFNEPHVMESRMLEEPISWWANHGASTPLLQSLAFKLLSQSASSSCCERNCSIYSFIQSVKRNKLATSRADDLVFVHCNLRLLSRSEGEYKEGPTKYWDLCGDNVDVDGQTSMELSELSLDEPQLQTFMLHDDDDVLEVD